MTLADLRGAAIAFGDERDHVLFLTRAETLRLVAEVEARDAIIARVTALLAEWAPDGPRNGRPYISADGLQALADALGVPLTPPCCTVCNGGGCAWDAQNRCTICPHCKGRGRAEAP